jgi:hypothetical protein
MNYHMTGDSRKFRVHNVRVALDPYYKDYEQEEFVCPILHEIMEDPWMTPAGINFERDAILQWLAKNKNCPMTRKRLTTQQLKPNLVNPVKRKK